MWKTEIGWSQEQYNLEEKGGGSDAGVINAQVRQYNFGSTRGLLVGWSRKGGNF